MSVYFACEKGENMKAVRVKIYQQCGQFRVYPHSGSLIPTYPLPPYSTISGMVHSACLWKEYHPLQISICKTSGTGKSMELESYYVGEGKTKNLSKDFTDRWSIIFKDGDHYHGWQKNIRKVELLWDREYIIHIIPENEEELNTIYKALKYPDHYLSLGRWEDVIMIEETKIVKLEDEPRPVQRFDADFYIPASYTQGTHDFICATYQITKNYKIVQEKRRFNKIKSYFLNPFYFNHQNIKTLHDEEEYPVFLA